MDAAPDLVYLRQGEVSSIIKAGPDACNIETQEASGSIQLQQAFLRGSEPESSSPTLALLCEDFAYLFVPGQPVTLSWQDGQPSLLLPTSPGCLIRATVAAATLDDLCTAMRVIAAAGFPIFLDGHAEPLPADTDFLMLFDQHANQQQKIPAELPGETSTQGGCQSEPAPDAIAQQAPAWSRGIAAGIGAAASLTAFGVKAAAGVASYGVRTVGSAINSRVTPRSSEPIQVSQGAKDRIAAVKRASDASLRATGRLVDKVEATTEAIGTSLAQRIVGGNAASASQTTASASGAGSSAALASQPTSVEEGAGGQQQQGASLLPPGLTNGLFHIGRAGFAAASTIWEGLEEGAQDVGGAAQEHSVLFAQKRYGEEVATATGQALKAAGGLAWSAYRLNGLGLKSAMKGVAKSTAKHSATGLLK